MDGLHDRQIDDMHKRLDAEEVNQAESEVPECSAEGSQDAPIMPKHSQMMGTESQITDPRTSQSQFAVIGHLDDDEPLPDIVGYEFDEWYLGRAMEQYIRCRQATVPMSTLAAIQGKLYVRDMCSRGITQR